MKTRCNRCKKKIDYGNRYCDECLTVVTKQNKTGLKDKLAEDIAKSSTWKKVRLRVIARDSNMCVNCFINGYIEHRKLQVHHIEKRTDNIDKAYEFTNLITLCRSCHEKVELLPISEQKKLFKNFLKEEREYSLL